VRAHRDRRAAPKADSDRGACQSLHLSSSVHHLSASPSRKASLLRGREDGQREEGEEEERILWPGGPRGLRRRRVAADAFLGPLHPLPSSFQIEVVHVATTCCFLSKTLLGFPAPRRARGISESTHTHHARRPRPLSRPQSTPTPSVTRRICSPLLPIFLIRLPRPT
jgi:hypothetical protein